jgi:hypothetical protein
MKRFSNTAILVLFHLVAFVHGPCLSQQNLIRNHSFEAGDPTKPTTVSQLEGGCQYWHNYVSIGPGYSGTSDWFDLSPGKLQGGVNCVCAGSTSLNQAPHPPTNDGSHFVGIIKQHPTDEGEGFDQRMTNKLDAGYYDLDFDYLLTCDTNWYGLKIYLGKGQNRLDYLAKYIPIPTGNIGQWQHFQTRLYVPTTLHNKLDWFIVLMDGSSPVRGTLDLGAYMYLDDFHLYKSPCTSCDPTGYMSWNAMNIRPYMTPDGDGVFDEWCMTNVNNVSWYEMWVIARWGPIYYRTESDADGFENYAICWDGRNQNGQLQGFDTYQVVVRLGNCNSQITHTWGVELVQDLQYNAYSVAPNYVPTLFGLEPSPTHYRDLHLYGGIYWGTHDWYACDAIWIDGAGAPRIPYFEAGYTANLGFYSSNGTFIEHGSTDFQLGADIDIQTQPVQCCPQLRLVNPDLPQELVSGSVDTVVSEIAYDDWEADEMDARSLAENESDEFRLNAYPNPATDILNISIHLPKQDLVQATLISASGIAISHILHLEALEAGDHTYSVSVSRFRMACISCNSVASVA